MQGVPQDFEQRSEWLLARLNEELAPRRRDGEIGSQALEKPGALALHSRHEREHFDRENGRWVCERIEDRLSLSLLERFLRSLAPQIHRDITCDPVRSAPESRIVLMSAARQRGCGRLRTHA